MSFNDHHYVVTDFITLRAILLFTLLVLSKAKYKFEAKLTTGPHPSAFPIL